MITKWVYEAFKVLYSHVEVWLSATDPNIKSHLIQYLILSIHLDSVRAVRCDKPRILLSSWTKATKMLLRHLHVFPTTLCYNNVDVTVPKKLWCTTRVLQKLQFSATDPFDTSWSLGHSYIYIIRRKRQNDIGVP